MNFELTAEEEMIRDAVRKLASEKIAPLADTLDRGEGRDRFVANLRMLAQQGFAAVTVDQLYGGTNAGSVALALVIEEIAYACATTATTLATTNAVSEIISMTGSEEQKRTHLPRLADGTYTSGSFCLTEPGAGSDAASLTTRARRVEGGYVLDGTKIYVTSGELSGVFVVLAVTDPSAGRGRGISCFLVESGANGMSIGKAERKLGQHGSPTNTISFDNCRLPASALLGAENGGFGIVAGLGGSRIAIAAQSLGIARAAMDAAKAYVRERHQFGRPVGQFQGIQWTIADREVDLEAARLLILSAAVKKDRGESYSKDASMAKLFASEAAHRATDTAIQLHGGAGYIADFPVERYARDARITRIYEGTSEIQRTIIARETLKHASART